MSWERKLEEINERIERNHVAGVVPEWKLEELRRKERERAQAAHDAVDTLDLPARPLRLLWSEKVRETEAVLALRATGTTTVLSGGPGCGKTVAAASWLFTAARDSGVRGMWVTGARIARWERYSNREMDKLLLPPRLVVDDLGGEFLDDRGSFMALLEELVNERYACERPTVLTTNLNAAAFKARYGERVADRIRDDGKFVVIASGSMRSA